MRFERVYPVEIWIRGKKNAKTNLEESLEKERPDIVVTGIEEMREMLKDISIYKVTGFSTNPQPR